MPSKNPGTYGTNALKNIFAPSALEFSPQHLLVGDQWAKVYAIHAFPPTVEAGWLTAAANLPGVTLSLHALPEDALASIQELNRRMGQLAGQLAVSKGGPLLAQRLERQIHNTQVLLHQMDAEQQSVFRIGVFLVVTAPDAATGARRARRLEGALAAQGMRARPLVFYQNAGLQAAGPWGLFDEALQGRSPHTWPVSTIAAAWPFGGGGINHGSGILLGHDGDNGLVLLDRWAPPADAGITNKNFAVLAPPGGGKSHATKLMMIREWLQGVKVIVVDPEREYRHLCAALGGAWVNAAGGGTRVNPLQPPALPADVDDDGTTGTQTPLMTHSQRVMGYFATYLPDLTAMQRAMLEQALEESYQQAGMPLTMDPEAIAATPADTWPHVGTVYRICQDHAAADPDADWAVLAALLRTAGEGALADLWAGPSTVPSQLAADFVVLDIHDLDDAPDTVKRAQYVNVLGYAWDLIRADRGARKMLVVDEAWMLIDARAPEALKFMKSLSKRIRKYGGSFNVVTQNVIDFLADAVRGDGEQVLTNAAYKLLLRQEGKDLEALTTLFSLSDAEQDLLSNARVGEGLLIAGNQRAWVTIDTAPHETTLLYGS